MSTNTLISIEKTLDKIYLFHQKDRIKVIHPLKSILNFKGDVKKSIKYSISINNYNRLEEFYNNNSYLDTQTPNLIFKLREEINEKLVFEEEMNNLTLKGRTISKFVKLKYDIDSNKVNFQEILNNIYTILYKSNIDGISINIKNYNDFINKLFNCDISKLLSNISKYLDGIPI